MAQIIIDIDNNKTNVVYKATNGTIMPICEVTESNYVINKTTDKNIIRAVSDIMFNHGITLDYQLYKQGFINKPSNKHVYGL